MNRIPAAAAALALFAAPAAFANDGSSRDARAREQASHCASMKSEHDQGARRAMAHREAAQERRDEKVAQPSPPEEYPIFTDQG